MKKLLVGLLALGSVASYSGVIENKTNGKFITLNQSEDAISIDGTNAGGYEMHSEITVEELDDKLQTYKKNHDYIYTFTRELTGDDYDESVDPIGVPFTIILDTAMLPATASAQLYLRTKTKKDFKLIRSSAATQKRTVVNKKRFKRIMKILEIGSDSNIDMYSDEDHLFYDCFFERYDYVKGNRNIFGKKLMGKSTGVSGDVVEIKRFKISTKIGWQYGSTPYKWDRGIERLKKTRSKVCKN